MTSDTFIMLFYIIGMLQDVACIITLGSNARNVSSLGKNIVVQEEVAETLKGYKQSSIHQ